MIRPTGVTLIAVLFFLGMALCGLAAIGMFVGGAFIGSIIGAAAQQRGAGAAGAGFGAMIGAIAGIFFLVIAALNGICGFGLWKMKEWARMLTIILAGIGAFFGVLGMMGGMMHFNVLLIFWRLIWLGIDVLIVWYLLQPQVKAAFAQPQGVPQVYPAR